MGLLISLTIQAEQISLNHLCSKLAEKSTKEEVQQFFNKRSILLKGSVPNEHLLFLLMDLFEQYEVKGPLVISFTEESGPEKITKSKSIKTLVKVSKNADELLLGTSLEKIAIEVCRKNSTKRKFTINYTNTIFEQFLRSFVSKETILKKLKLHTGIRYRSLPSETGYKEEQSFRTEELVTIFKQFVDIPRHVYSNMSLVKIVRYRMGNELGNNVAADYTNKYRRIRLSDAATMEGSDIFGEGTIIHEMGHAYDYGASPKLMNSFYNISWKKNGTNWILKRNDSKGMISDYSMKSEKEDFAEHFSGFVNNPEALKQASMEKYVFFKYKIFKDTEYFTTVAKNAKVNIDSDITDLTKPSLMYGLSQSVKVVKTGSRSNQLVKIRIRNAKDNLSGIVKTLIAFKHVDNPQNTIFIDAKPIKNDNSYDLVGETVLDPRKLAKGRYQLTVIMIEDGAGNKTFYKASPISEIYVDGDLSANQERSKKINIENIKVTTLESNDYPRMEVTIPTTHKENLKNIHLGWVIKSIEEKTTHVISHFYSNPGDPFVKVIVRFHNQYPKGIVSLSSILLQYKGTQSQGKRKERHLIPSGHKNTIGHIRTGHKDFNLNTASLNRIKLTSKIEENKKGGKYNIIVEMPMSNVINESTTSVGITFRDPKGKQIYSYTSESSRSRSQLEDIVDSNGDKVIRVIIPLKKFPVSGDYIFESIKVETKIKNKYSKKEPMDLGKGLIKRYKLIERGIRKTFSVSDDHKLILN